MGDSTVARGAPLFRCFACGNCQFSLFRIGFTFDAACQHCGLVVGEGLFSQKKSAQRDIRPSSLHEGVPSGGKGGEG